MRPHLFSRTRIRLSPDRQFSVDHWKKRFKFSQMFSIEFKSRTQSAPRMVLSRFPGESYGKLSVRHSRRSLFGPASVTSTYQVSKIRTNHFLNCAIRRLALLVATPDRREKSRMSLFNPRSIPLRTWSPNSSYPLWFSEHVSSLKLMKNF